MKAVGLITEYNPFHNGHILHINEAMNLTNADVSIAVMSGDFVQRGEPAIIDKYSRCRAAIESGINLLVELPVYYSLSSAEGFAQGAVKTLAALGADDVVFGSESADICLLKEIASVLYDEPEIYRTILKDELSKGYSFPVARQKALIQYFTDKKAPISAELLSGSNNILALEYIKAIYKYHLNINALTIKRKGCEYNDTAIEGTLASASAIRNRVYNFNDDGTCEAYNLSKELSNVIPKSMHKIITSSLNVSSPISINDFTPLLNYKLAIIFNECANDKNAICKKLCLYEDINTELGNRIAQMYDQTLSFKEFGLKIKCRQYTFSRICRCLFHIILDITKIEKNKYEGNLVPYVRILGFDKIGQKYLNSIKNTCTVPLITKTAEYKDLLREDIYASSIYNQVVFNKYKTSLKDEFRAGIYIKK